MPRNIERDAREEERRRKQILDTGLRLFSERGIDNVSLQSVAEEAEVGIATLYNYYQNKINLCIAISRNMWYEVMEHDAKITQRKLFESKNAYEKIEAYFDLLIFLYRDHPEVLRFSGDYKTFISKEKIEGDVLEEHLSVLQPVRDLFHEAYEMAYTDKTIRTDILEEELVTTVAFTALGMAENYAKGLVWAVREDRDYTSELEHLKNMMLEWIKNK